MYPFRYCTVEDAQQYSGTQESNEKIIQKIELWSRIINDYTGKVFVPVYVDAELEQLYDDRFVMTNSISILEMSEPVEVQFSRREVTDVPFTTDLLSSDDPTQSGSSLLYTQVDVVGYFGNIQKNRDKVTTTVSGSVAVGSDEITLADSSGVSAGDVLLIDSYVTAIVTACCDNNVVKVNALASGLIDEDEVIVFGKVLPDIVYCIQELVSKKGFGVSEQRNLKFQEQLIMEQTDSYMYRLANAVEPYSVGTGILEVDRILERYRETVDVRLI